MMQNQLGMQLHDRHTRGQELSVEELKQLEAWYREQDELEAKDLHLLPVAVEDITQLQSQIDVALGHLEASIQQVQQITATNGTLRQEIAILKQRLVISKSA